MPKAKKKAEPETPLSLTAKIRVTALSELHADPANARVHNPKNMNAIKSSLVNFGQVESIVAQQSTGKIIGGNGRFEAMQQLGWTEASVAWVDLSDTQATALGIALNRTAELAEWDDQTLAALLESLGSQDVDLDALGFSDKEMQKLLEELNGKPVSEDAPGGKDKGDQFLVLVTCADRDEQFELLKRLGAEGMDCKPLG